MAQANLIDSAEKLIAEITEEEIQYPDLSIASELAQQLLDELSTVFGD